MFGNNKLIEYLSYNAHLVGKRDEILTFLIKKLLEYYKKDFCFINIFENEHLIPIVKMNVPQSINIDDKIPAVALFANEVLKSGEPFIVEEIKTNGQNSPDVISGILKAKSYFGYPLFNSLNIMIGTICIYGLNKGGIDPKDVCLISSYSTRLVLEIDNNRLKDKNHKIKKALDKFAITDTTTGVYKKSYLIKKLEDEFRRAKRYNRYLSCMMISIHNHNEIVEKYGVNFANCIIKETSDSLKKSIREIDLIFRYSNNAFFVVLPETNMDHTFLLSERIKVKIEAASISTNEIIRKYENITFDNRIKGLDENLFLKLKIGLSSFPENNVNSAMDLIRVSDNFSNQSVERDSKYVN